ncbi:MAG: PfaD family polyunsaturated fatty acid/polyketide biosynthesis protein [Pedosphaera sp.]|nr:PfaD family polyunsaturated fatty acid/polyketide biosynthesis protein [Pedosphaera sp.]
MAKRTATETSDPGSLRRLECKSSSSVADESELARAIGRLRSPLFLLKNRDNGVLRLANGEADTLTFCGCHPKESPGTLNAYIPAIGPECLGDPGFIRNHAVRYAYVAGAMANGIGSTRLVEEMARASMLAIFGAAGLSLARVEEAIVHLAEAIPNAPHGFNLIHSPNEPELESAVSTLYVQRAVRFVEASAYLRLTLPIVRYRVAGIHRDQVGNIRLPNSVIAKVSRVEVATQFLSPPPHELLSELVRKNELTLDQAAMASEIPMAGDVTAEADSAGHTDNRPLVTLLPTLLALRDRIQARYRYERTPRIGAAGGLSTPSSVAGAFAMGAAYVVTGSINQACVESGSCDAVRQMLAQAEQADVAMAPAADMFEMGVKVQVLKRGTMFPMRASRLYELYRTYPSLDSLPEPDRAFVEKQLLRVPLEEAWRGTREFFLKREPRQVERAERDPKHKMALVFRSYLGLSSRWANSGEPSRTMDYQIWCGPAMGAFNEWTRGTFLEKPENRKVVVVAHNLLHGAAALLRQHFLSLQGIRLPAGLASVHPLEPATMREAMNT